MQFKKIVILFFLSFSTLGFSQEMVLSPLSKVSLLTVGTADELSSQFGHTAIRIQDTTNNIDYVFGYGGFDFEDPLFYSKFTTGKLDYSMTAHRFQSFLGHYKVENRWVHEQELNFTLAQRNQLLAYLKNNYREENRLYKYDFLFDNCATKIPEVFNSIFKNTLDFNYNHIEKPSTFRELIHESLSTNSWSTFGIDLALGSVIDRAATEWEHQFLPLYVQKQFDNTKIDGEPLVSKNELLFEAKPVSENKLFFLSPLFWLIIFLAMVSWITYRNHKQHIRSRWLDFTLFFVNGIAGVLIAFLWFATDHTSTKVNFNILWALAPNIVIAFYFLKKKPPKWLEKYLWILLAGIVLTAILWLFKIQIFSPLLIFVLVALTIRYLFLLHHLKHSKSLPTEGSSNNLTI